MSDNRVLVAGTTADYIEVLVDRYANQLLFVTEPAERQAWIGPNPDKISEVLSPLNDETALIEAVKKHAHDNNINITGVVSFDCESLALASTIASALNLPSVPKEAILQCRSKYLSKEIWRKAGVGCPEAKLIYSEEEAVSFWKSLNSAAVIKPLSASGSELIFLCRDEKSCREAYKKIIEKLQQHSNRLYSENTQAGIDPRKVILMERCIGGDEYSADFILENNEVQIIRLAKKLMRKEGVWGTPLAYIMPADFPSEMKEEVLALELKRAAQSLGINRMIGMVDLRLENGKIYLIELSARSGGDCLPQLIEASSGFDILKAQLDFVQGKKVVLPPRSQWKKYVSVLFIADQAGLVKALDVKKIMDDPRTVSAELYYAAGHTVVLPPEDYETRRLGYVIIEPYLNQDIEKQCLDILGKLTLEMEQRVASVNLR